MISSIFRSDSIAPVPPIFAALPLQASKHTLNKPSAVQASTAFVLLPCLSLLFFGMFGLSGKDSSLLSMYTFFVSFFLGGAPGVTG